MTARSVPNLRTVKVDALTHPCPEAGGRARTRQPTARLDRWIVLRDLLVDAWANPHEDTEELLGRHLSGLSPLEADLIRRMYLNVERVLPIPEDAEVDLEGQRVVFDDHDAGVSTAVRLTFTITHPDGSVEHVRLKTGRRSSTDEEAAVVWATAEDGESFVDLMAWPGEVEPIDPPTDSEERLRRLIQTSPLLTGSGVEPGPQCVWCPRTATCGAYPAGRVVPVNAHTLNLTKTDVQALGRCQRRVAWRRVHGIPRDDGDDDEAIGATSHGRLFHDMLATAHGGDGGGAVGDDDAERAAEGFLDGVPPSEVADLRTMWENHRRLLDEEGLTVRRSEFPVGVTLLEGAGADLRGATLLAFVDLTARTADGSPVAVEVKTGGAGDTAVEDDLYAVGMRRWIGGDVPVVVHRHHVGPAQPGCDVVEMSPAEVERAAERLRGAVSVVHDWDWDDPLQPSYSVGEWCTGCEFRTTCESYR